MADGAARTYTMGSGTNALSLRVTAWSLNNNSATGTVSNARLGRYSSGLGVTNDAEDGSSPGHTTDNSGRLDFLVFQFSKPVEVLSGVFTPFAMSGVYDVDYTLGAGLSDVAWNSSLGLDGQSRSTLNTLFANDIRNFAGSASNGNAQTKALDSLHRAGNVWLVGASFNNPDSKYDAFKFSALKVLVPVPEPSTWLMMIVGFGFVGASIRRQRKHQQAALAA